MKQRTTTESNGEINMSQAELLQAIKGVYTSSNEEAKNLRIGLPAPAPIITERSFALPQAMSKLVDAYIGYTIKLNGHEETEQNKKTYAGHIVTELFRISIAGDKTFEKYLQQKADENINGDETTNSKSGSTEADFKSNSQSYSTTNSPETTAVTA